MSQLAFSATIPIVRSNLRGETCRRTKRNGTRTTTTTIRMAARAENEPDLKVSTAVEKLYDVYPFPPETLLDEEPLGYNWRWHYPTVHSFCTNIAPPKVSARPLRILDAGCGTGESTSYLAFLNPDAEITAIDLSAGALQVAKERLDRSLPSANSRVNFIHKSIFDVNDIDGQFDYINSVGVIHHTPDPKKALNALAGKLKPGGICHIFVYAKNGRWEISLMQKAIKLLRKDDTNFENGVQLGRDIFETLPDDNRLKLREKNRWAQENKKDATFADMYLHPCEVDYDITTLFELIDQSGLDFLGFSNPANFNLERIFSDPSLLNKARSLPIRQQFELIELLDPESVTHFEFFLAKPPFAKISWEDDLKLAKANASISSCITGWPSPVLLDRDYSPLFLKEKESAFLKHIEQNGNVGEAASHSQLPMNDVRELINRSVLIIQDPEP